MYTVSQDIEGIEYPPSELNSHRTHSYRQPVSEKPDQMKQQFIINEEQRIYIEILKSALEEKLTDHGILFDITSKEKPVDLYMECLSYK